MSCDKKSLLTSKRGRGVDNTGRGIAMKLCEDQGGKIYRDRRCNRGARVVAARNIQGHAL